MSATGNPRNKVALKPGHSLIDWIRLGNSEDLAGTGGAVLCITKDELARHSSPGDVWTCIRGNVYNISRYLDFHPGGVAELMRGAGIDATALFTQVHPWVNYLSILKKCYVGRLSHAVDPSDFALPSSSRVGTSSNSLPSSSTKQITSPNENHVAVGSLVKTPVATDQLNCDWYQQETFITLVIYIKEFPRKFELHNEEPCELCVCLNEIHSNWRLAGPIVWPPLLTITETKVEAKFTKVTSVNWPELPSKSGSECRRLQQVDNYEEMIIKHIDKVNHNVFHIGLAFSEGLLAYVPIGYHVPLRATINGTLVERNYTPVCGLHSKLPNDVNLLVKAYPDGVFSSWLTSRKVGDIVEMGPPMGGFSTQCISHASHLVLLAAGTGITPMTRLISWALARRSIVKEVELIFFNKKEKDIIWKSDIDKLLLSNRRFKYRYILSDGDVNWKEARGYVTPQLLHDVIPDLSAASSDVTVKYYIAVCGPIAFTQLTDRYLKDLGYTSPENYFCF